MRKFLVNDPDLEPDPGDDDLDLLDEAEVGYLVGHCQSGWQGSGMYWEGNKADLEKAVKKLQVEHVTKCNCGNDPFIGIT